MSEYLLQENPRVSVADVQKVLLMMVKEIKRICEKYDIPYWLNGGSALGAIRHQGFIPWDDDLDIAMMLDDYHRFIEVLKTDLSSNYYFQCFETDTRYNVLIPAMKIRLKDTQLKEINWLLRNKCLDGEGVFIDVFVYRHLASFNSEKLYRLQLYGWMPLMVILDNIGINTKALKRAYVNRRNKYDKMNKKSSLIGFDWVWRSFKKPFVFVKTDILPVKMVNFEDIMLPVANNFEKFLDMAIAVSWRELPPLEHRAPKHIIKIDLGRYKDDECQKNAR